MLRNFPRVAIGSHEGDPCIWMDYQDNIRGGDKLLVNSCDGAKSDYLDHPMGENGKQNDATVFCLLFLRGICLNNRF